MIIAESLTHSTTLDALGAALAKAQASVKGAKKDAANPFYKTQYADLGSVWDACREALTANGLSVVQFPGPVVDGCVTLTTILLHSSGQWISGTAAAPLAKQDAQGVGSALTYLRRYALAAVASVAPEDDDGNAATGRDQRPARRRTEPHVNPTAQDLSAPPAQLTEPDPEAFPVGPKPVVWPFAKAVGSLKTGVAIDASIAPDDLASAVKFIDIYTQSPTFTKLVEKKGVKVAREIEAIREHIQLVLDAKTSPEAA